jgi:hypothetical protein
MSKFSIYLAGAMEYAADGGKGWRSDLTKAIKRFGKDKINILDPVKLEAEKMRTLGVKDKKWILGKNANQNSPEFIEFRRVMRAIIAYDIGLVNRSNLIVADWSTETKNGAGTHGEITHAFMRGIPILLLTRDFDMDVPAWILGCIAGRATSILDVTNLVHDIYKGL